jgi:hypothetical protein
MLRLLGVTGLSLGLVLLAPAYAAERVALVVGNSSYQAVPKLDNPANDAKLMAETLTRLGFLLVGGSAQLDLDKAGFDHAVQAFGSALQGAEVGLFYYAGHGVQVRGANFLVPVNANPTREADVDFQMLDVALVLRQMESSGTRLNLVILDACRNNPFGGRGLRASGGGLAQMQAPEGTLISYAIQPGNVAQDGEDGHIHAWPVGNDHQGPRYFPDLQRRGAASETQDRRRAATLGLKLADRRQLLLCRSGGRRAHAAAQSRTVTGARIPALAPAPEPEPKLVRLPEPAQAEASRPRGARENCTRSGNATYCVSSMLPPAHGNNYGARNLTDGDDSTAWVEGSGGQGAGDFVVVEFDAPRLVGVITLRNGYAKNPDIFGKNSRVKDVELNFSTGDSLQATLTDQTGEQRVNLNRPVKAKWVQLVIRSVYPGWKYSDTALNELRVDAQ